METSIVDSPIKRTTISELTPAQLDAHITMMQERRMRSHTVYQEAMAAKAAIKDEKDKLQYEKRLVQLEKVLKQAENALDKANTYHNEIKVLRITLGDL